jgi:hypothetical protein
VNRGEPVGEDVRLREDLRSDRSCECENRWQRDQDGAKDRDQMSGMSSATGMPSQCA